MTSPARAAVDILDDLLRRRDDGDALILKFVGLGLSAGVILVCAGLWLARKVGV